VAGADAVAALIVFTERKAESSAVKVRATGYVPHVGADRPAESAGGVVFRFLLFRRGEDLLSVGPAKDSSFLTFEDSGPFFEAGSLATADSGVDIERTRAYIGSHLHFVRR
jgi:hypothetical protein